MNHSDHLDDQLANYHFELPQDLIAQRPVVPRDHSRLLVYHCSSGEVAHAHFYELHHYLPRGSVLIGNDSKVFACRLLGRKASGGQAEIFFLTPVEGAGPYPVLIKCSGPKRPGDRYFVGETSLELVRIHQSQFWLKGDGSKLREILAGQGLVPIPPYIRGGISDQRDRKDYQTLYAQREGSVAAPTAGLHFTPRVLQNLAAQDIAFHHLTLHVGQGTFAPIRGEDLCEHRMHQEQFFIPPETARAIQHHWGELFCVGTTGLRVLESLGQSFKNTGDFPRQGETDLFLRPGSIISSIRGLITNFHLPLSSLFILVCALIGRERALALYQTARDQGYRFYSYGDAMLVLR